MEKSNSNTQVTEKAKELIEKFRIILCNLFYKDEELTSAAQKCALICLDEILKELVDDLASYRFTTLPVIGNGVEIKETEVLEWSIQ